MANRGTSPTTTRPPLGWAEPATLLEPAQADWPRGWSLRGAGAWARKLATSANRAVVDWLAACSPASLIWLWFGIALLVGEVGWLCGPEWSFTIFYLLPVTGAAWFSGRTHGLAVAVFSAVVWLLAEAFTATSSIREIAMAWNFSARLLIFVFVVFMLDHIRTLNARLAEKIVQRTRELETEVAHGLAMAREMANISHREQQRIAHELHDGLGQELGAVAFQAKLLAANLLEGGAAFSAEAERMTLLVNQSIGRARALSHLLDPLGAESGGLRQALSELVDRSGEAFAIACTFEAPTQLPELGGEAALNLYRVAQEAVHNAVEHGHATQIFVRAQSDAAFLKLSITDDGCGFDIESTSPGQQRGMGLRIMRYRAVDLGGRLEIESAPGQGCKVTCRVPLARAEGLRGQ
jgi:signal transduction histidine kinase